MINSSATHSRFTTRELVFMAFFSALTAIGAFIKIPVPYCPFTPQLFIYNYGRLTAWCTIGQCFAVWVYIALGLLGLPVFTNGGGPGYVFQPTFGYLIGFALGSRITGMLSQGAVSFKNC